MVNDLLVKDELVVKVLVFGVDTVDDRGVQGVGRLGHDDGVFAKGDDGRLTGCWRHSDCYDASLLSCAKADGSSCRQHAVFSRQTPPSSGHRPDALLSQRCQHATPPEGPSLDDQSVTNGKIMLGALSVSGAVGKLKFWPDVALRGQFASCYPSEPRRDQNI